MEIKTTKIEFKELLSNLTKAASFITDKAIKASDFDLARKKVARLRIRLEKRNGCIEGESGDSD